MSEPTPRRRTVGAPGGRPPSAGGRVPPRSPGQHAGPSRTAPPGGRPLPRDAVGARDRRHQRSTAATYRRRRLVVLGGSGLVVVALGLIVAFGWPGLARSADPAPTPAPTVTVAAPTPTVAPVERTDTTEFARALPATVLNYALVAEQPDDAFLEAGALEAYSFTYADGTGADATTVTVVAGQWPTTEEADDAASHLLSTLGVPVDSGEVVANGEKAGTYARVEPGDGTATVVWTNATAVFQASGPAAAVRDLYSAFPL